MYCRSFCKSYHHSRARDTIHLWGLLRSRLWPVQYIQISLRLSQDYLQQNGLLSLVAEGKYQLWTPFCGILAPCHRAPWGNSAIRCPQPQRLACLSSTQACVPSTTSSRGWVPRRCRQVPLTYVAWSQGVRSTKYRTVSHPIPRRQCMSSIRYQRYCNVSDA